MIDPVHLAREAGLKLNARQVDMLTAIYVGAPQPFAGGPHVGRRLVIALLCAAQIADGEAVTIGGRPDDVEATRQRALQILDRRDRLHTA